MTIKISTKLEMPLNAATKTFAILAKRGAGKTYTAAVLAEEFHANGIPFVVIDPIDVWWGLRLAANGKDAGLPVVIFGIENADIILDRDMGRQIAQQIVKNNISCVISTFGMSKTAQRHLVAEFSEELLRINNTPRHVFIEEAHEYLPQRVLGGLAVCFNAVNNLVVMGRNRGIGVSLINQRAATLNKDSLTQADTLIALRSIGPQDRDALEDWVNFHGTDTKKLDKFIASLPSLPTGEAWIWSPEFLDLFELVKIRNRSTFHPDREKLGTNFEMPTIQHGDIEEFIRNFPKTQAPGQKEKKQPLLKPLQEVFVPEQVNVQQLKNEYESKLMQKDIEIRRLTDTINRVRTVVGETKASSPVPSTGSSQIEMWMTKLGSGQPSKILRFLAEHTGLTYTRSQVALGCGYSPSSGGFNSALALLRRNNLVVDDGAAIKINPNL